MANPKLLNAQISAVFPEWSSTRMARWLGVNARTLQRWMKSADQIDEAELPDDLRDKVRSQAAIVRDIDLPGQLDGFIQRQRENGIDDEVLAAWMAHRYKGLVGREVD